MKQPLEWSSLLAALLLMASVCRGVSPAFPKPHPETAFPELKRVDAAGHSWRRPQEDWRGAQMRVEHDPNWRRWLAAEQAEVDRWINRHQDHVEWTCGLWHDFVSPKDGSFLTWTDEIPRQEIGYLHSPSDARVDLTPKLVEAWVYKFRVAHAEMITRAARLWRLTGNPHYRDWAARQLDFYADHYSEWPEHRDGSRLYAQTLDVAVGLVQYAAAVRTLGNYPAAERKLHWFHAFFQPQAELLQARRQDFNNIATWHRSAQAQVALVFQDEAGWRTAIDGPFGLRQQLAHGVTSDYLWYEQSFGYDSYVVKTLLSLFTTAGLAGRVDELEPELNVTENLLLAPVYLRFPDGHAPNPADNPGPAPLAPDRTTFALAYRIFPTWIGLRAAAEIRSWDELLDPPLPPPAGILPRVISRNLESSRMAVLKKGPWQLFLHYGQLTHSHAQAEALNFSAFYGETDITHDPGTVGYSSPLHRDYYSRGLNHNVPLFDGEGETPPQPGVLKAYSEDPALLTAEQPNYGQGAQASRTLAIRGDALVDQVDLVSTTGPRHLGLSLHLQGHARLSASFTPDPAFATGRPPAFGFWQNVSRAAFARHVELTVDFPGQPMRLSFDSSQPFTLWHASTPDIPPRRREGFYLELSAPASEARITTQLQPAPLP